MATLLVLGPFVPTEVAGALDAIGHGWKAAANADAADTLLPAGGWGGALVVADHLDVALRLCRSIRMREEPIAPVLLVVTAEQLRVLDVVEDLFDDFILLPLRSGELETRVRHWLWRTSGGSRPDVVQYGALTLNLSTYQASVSGRALDMTYMEYELLKHFVTHPGRVLTRQDLLRQVWGYEYYGGARTVDVHVRRLRAKLGEEHAPLISTVRSVGYIFGRPRYGESLDAD